MSRRVYHHHSLWEDHRCGLYKLPSASDCPLDQCLCATLLKSPMQFYLTAIAMIQSWPVSAAVQLSNRSRNRRAWVGQASCCYAHGSPEHITKCAWHTLTETEQVAANSTADDVIKLWESCYA